MNTYCSKSWTDINIDFESRNLRHCCKSSAYEFPENLTIDFISRSSQIQERRQQSLQGIAHADCIQCWNDYDKGNTAFRDWANNWKDDYIGPHRHLLDDDRNINYIEIKTDRTCDMACIYCSPGSSSKIAQEEGIRYNDNTSQKDYDVFKDWLMTHLSRKDLTTDQFVLIFLGGEPTASERFYELVDYIELVAEKTGKKIRLEICTNCNSKPYLMNKIIERMDASNLSWGIGVSNESYGHNAELIRHGLDWQRFSDNFVRYIAHKKTELIVMSPTSNVFSLKTFHQYIDWVHDQFRQHAPNKEFTWFGNHTNWPFAMDVANLPKEYTKYIDLAESAISRATDINYVYRENFVDYLNQMRVRIGSAYDPEYKEKAEQFLLSKQKIKKTTALINLMDNLNL